ncbi:YceH family protein [Tahibacter amnicola]|uniref:YceH family protein n=1 Tax=Tahibacter amnicola TaxID=2976241 RepID=A0ABY6BIJ0_9GAMM|nr:YceH family protein [Tahibacter amnicola]UXI69829.1 YceH family protein [Tahibacter amnicola]
MSESDNVQGFPLLNANEARVLGCLVEKAATTPEVYPLTLNAVVGACNQKSNRDPVMNLEQGEVGHTLRQLESKRLVAGSMSARVSRYEHRMDQALNITPRQRALLAVMMLRGPQTIAELLTRTERLADFGALDDVRATLDRLCQREPALAVRLPRGAGQREDRYMHLLCGESAATAAGATISASPGTTDEVTGSSRELEQRIAQLESLVEALQTRLSSVEQRIDTSNEP